MCPAAFGRTRSTRHSAARLLDIVPQLPCPDDMSLRIDRFDTDLVVVPGGACAVDERRG
jgi:hypothetical protein